jgi:hypothetical protein
MLKTDGTADVAVTAALLALLVKTAKRTARVEWSPSLSLASGLSTQAPARARTTAISRPSSMHSPASQRLRRLQVTTTTSCDLHRMAPASATADAPPWAASTSLPTTTVRDTIVGTTIMKGNGHGRPSPNHPRVRFPLPPRLPLALGCRPSLREPQHRPLQRRHHHPQRNQPHRRDGKASSEELQLLLLHQPLKNRSHNNGIPDNAA